jgi:seryl-tRNA synthetase
MSVTDPFDTVREALAAGSPTRNTADRDALDAGFAALASIEERLREAERERDELREYRDQMNEILSREDIHDYWFGIGKSCSLGEAFSDLLARVAELEEALREIENAGDRAAVQIARSALATSEQARTPAEDAHPNGERGD